jgi:hypothetical protein
MIYRGPGFLVVWFGSWPSPFPPSSVSKLSLFLSLPACRRSNLLARERGVGEEPNREKAWPSINHSCSLKFAIRIVHQGSVIYSRKSQFSSHRY